MIESALPSDGPSILELVRSTGVFNEEEVQCVREVWDEYLAGGEEKSGYAALVYRQDDRVLGFTCYGLHPLTKGVYDLYWIAVDPKVQGQGIGQALMTQTELEVARRGGRKLLVETSSTPAYAPARRLYERCGYQLEAVVHDFYAISDDLLIYSKRLEARAQEAA